MKFTDKDIQQIESKGLNLDLVKKQIEIFETGIPFTNISEAATIKRYFNKKVRCSIQC